MLPRSNPSHHATHQSAGTKAALFQTLLALLYMSQDALCLCVHIFLRVSLFPSISLSLSPSCPRPPLFPLVICFLPVGFGIPFIESTLFASYPFLRMGPERQNGRLWVPWSLLAPCHTMMSWLLFAAGAPIDFPSVLHTLYLPLSPSLTSTPVFLHQSLSQILLLLKRRLGDLGMFGCCLSTPTVHA